MSAPPPPLDTLWEHVQNVSAAVRVDRTFDAIVVLPYTRVRRRGGGPAASYRMSHFTARCVLAGLELYQQRVALHLILPGEQRAPATSDLERAFLLNHGVAPERIVSFPNRNGTVQQLQPIARLQGEGQFANVLVVCFAFHTQRVREYMRLLGIRGDVAEVEQTHATFLRIHARATRVNRQELINLPQMRPITEAEQGISRTLLRIDRLFGRWAPAARLFKLLAGPTITDIERGRTRIGLARVETAGALVYQFEARVKRKLRLSRGTRS